MRHLITLITVSLLTSFALVSSAQAVDVPPRAYAEGAVDDGDPRVEARLVLDHAVAEPGAALRVGVLFTLDPDWHIYWKDSGEAGLATEVEYSSPHAEFEDLVWPQHRKFVDPSGLVTTYGYADEVMLWAPGRLSSDASGEVTVEARINYLACKVKCIPGEALLRQTLPVSSEPKPSEARILALFDRYPPGSEKALETPEHAKDGGADKADAEAEAEAPEAANASEASAPAVPEVPWWQVLLLALLGGMILNLMPCVFPVLAIKVFAFVNLAHENRANLAAHAGSYTGGILASMLALAGVVVGLKWAGTQVGWGFQFQEPAFVVALSAVLVLFALNLFGAFEVTVSAGKFGSEVATAHHSLRRSFAEGVLAVVLATPCSAPFLGTAVGFAFASEAWVIFAVFVTLGLGLALPFVALTAMPSWTKVLPKPGSWMLRFKQVLGFALLGTVVWLAWVLGQSGGSGAVVRLLAFVLAIAVAAWMWGAVQFGEPRRKVAVGLLALVTVVAAGWLFRPWQIEAPAANATRDAGDSIWRPYDPEAVQDELEAGRVVFVDFTADWCITCKANETTVLDRPAMHAFFRDHDIATFKADWTRRDETIRRELARYGKAGVPMYLVYSPASPDTPRVLPEVLTSSLVMEALQSAAK